jgi:hypothetical protein
MGVGISTLIQHVICGFHDIYDPRFVFIRNPINTHVHARERLSEVTSEYIFIRCRSEVVVYNIKGLDTTKKTDRNSISLCPCIKNRRQSFSV